MNTVVIRADYYLPFHTQRTNITGHVRKQPLVEGEVPKGHPPHGPSSGSSFSVKRARKGQVLQQEPVLRKTHRKSMGRVL